MSKRVGRHLVGMFICVPVLLSTTACAIGPKYAASRDAHAARVSGTAAVRMDDRAAQ